jgi:hypothetical protein
VKAVGVIEDDNRRDGYHGHHENGITQSPGRIALLDEAGGRRPDESPADADLLDDARRTTLDGECHLLVMYGGPHPGASLHPFKQKPGEARILSPCGNSMPGFTGKGNPDRCGR